MAAQEQIGRDEAVQVVRMEPFRILHEWESSVRPFKKRDREFFTTLGAIVFLVVVILLFLKEWFFIGAIVAFSFLVYVLSTVPPGKVKHKISNRGIITANEKYPWDILERFWIKEQSGQSVLFVETAIRLPRRLMLILNKGEEGKVEKILNDYLPLDEPEQTWFEKTSDWLVKMIPLDKSS